MDDLCFERQIKTKINTMFPNHRISNSYKTIKKKKQAKKKRQYIHLRCNCSYQKEREKERGNDKSSARFSCSCLVFRVVINGCERWSIGSVLVTSATTWIVRISTETATITTTIRTTGVSLLIISRIAL